MNLSYCWRLSNEPRASLRPLRRKPWRRRPAGWQQIPAALDSGEIGHYQILSRLGEGGMGVVYKARDKQLDRSVALKILSAGLVADPEHRKRLVLEAKLASALNHPNIITVHEIASQDGIDFIVMEYVAGKSLDQLIPPGGLPLKRGTKGCHTNWRRVGRSPCGRHHPSGPQTGQRDGERKWAGEGVGLRPGQTHHKSWEPGSSPADDAGIEQCPEDSRGDSTGDRRLHVARTS